MKKSVTVYFSAEVPDKKSKWTFDKRARWTFDAMDRLGVKYEKFDVSAIPPPSLASFDFLAGQVNSGLPIVVVREGTAVVEHWDGYRYDKISKLAAAQVDSEKAAGPW